MASTFWRLKRKKKILANRPKVRGSGRLARIKGHAKVGTMMTANMAADELRSKGIDRVTGAFDRLYFNIDRKGRDVKKEKRKEEGAMSEQQLDEIWGTIAKIGGKYAGKTVARRAAAQAAKKAAKTAAKTSSGAAGSIARRTAPKVTKKVAQSALDTGPVKYVQKRSGRGIAAMTRRKSHRINAFMRKKRMLRTKEMRMKPATAMAKQAARGAAGDVAMRSVVDVGSHVISTPAKTAYDKAAGTPERHSTKRQAQNRQAVQNQQRSRTNNPNKSERLTASYREAAATLLEAMKKNNAKQFGKHHSLHNAMVSLHRTQGFKPTPISNNPSGRQRTNTRSRQNSDVTALDNIIEGSVQRIQEVLGVATVVKTVMKPQMKAAQGVGKAIGKKLFRRSDVHAPDNISEIAPLLAVAGGTVVGTMAAEAGMAAAKKGYAKYKATRAKSKQNIAAFKANRRAPMTREDREEILQALMEVDPVTLAGAGAVGVGTVGWAARRLVKRNKINKGIYARKAKKLEKKAARYDDKAQVKQAQKNIRTKFRGKVRSTLNPLSRPKRIKRLQRAEKRLSRQIGEGIGMALVPDAVIAVHGKQAKMAKKVGKKIGGGIVKKVGGTEVPPGQKASFGARRAQNKADRLRRRAARARKTSDVFAAREQRGKAKKLNKVRTKLAKLQGGVQEEKDYSRNRARNAKIRNRMSRKEAKAILAKARAAGKRYPENNKEARAAGLIKRQNIAIGAGAMLGGYAAGKGLKHLTNPGRRARLSLARSN